MALQDMSMTPAEAKEYNSPTVSDSEAPKYPYGLNLDCNSDTLEKLGITKLPAVGEEVAITAVAKVTRISAYEEQDGSEQCMGLQITLMEVDIPSQATSAADRLYSKTQPAQGD